MFRSYDRFLKEALEKPYTIHQFCLNHDLNYTAFLEMMPSICILHTVIHRKPYKPSNSSEKQMLLKAILHKIRHQNCSPPTSSADPVQSHKSEPIVSNLLSILWPRVAIILNGDFKENLQIVKDCWNLDFHHAEMIFNYFQEQNSEED